MAKSFRPYEPDQLRLMPRTLADWVPEGQLARFVSDLVEDLDLAAIEDTYTVPEIGPPGLRWRGLETGLSVPRQSSTLLKTAKALGLTIPPAVLARADQVIE